MSRVLFTLVSSVLFAASACATPVEAPEVAEAEPAHPLSFMFGEWVGEASGVGRNNTTYKITQTERVGPMLEGDIVVIEGKGYDSDGMAAFNAFAVVSPNRDGTWDIRSYAQGNSGTFPFTPGASGFTWSTPAGPDAEMRFTATFGDNTWSQVGEYVASGRPPVQTFQMELKRIGPTDWPSAGAVDPDQ